MQEEEDDETVEELQDKKRKYCQLEKLRAVLVRAPEGFRYESPLKFSDDLELFDWNGRKVWACKECREQVANIRANVAKFKQREAEFVPDPNFKPRRVAGLSLEEIRSDERLRLRHLEALNPRPEPKVVSNAEIERKKENFRKSALEYNRRRKERLEIQLQKRLLRGDVLIQYDEIKEMHYKDRRKLPIEVQEAFLKERKWLANQSRCKKESSQTIEQNSDNTCEDDTYKHGE